MTTLNTGDGRKSSTVGQRVGGQTLVGAANLAASGFLLDKGVDPQMVSFFTVAFQAIATVVGKILRNLLREKGWLKYVG